MWINVNSVLEPTKDRPATLHRIFARATAASRTKLRPRGKGRKLGAKEGKGRRKVWASCEALGHTKWRASLMMLMMLPATIWQRCFEGWLSHSKTVKLQRIGDSNPCECLAKARGTWSTWSVLLGPYASAGSGCDHSLSQKTCSPLMHQVASCRVLCHFCNASSITCTMPKLGQRTGIWSLRQALRIRNRQTDPCAKDQKCLGSAPCNATFRKWNEYVLQKNCAIDSKLWIMYTVLPAP